MAKGLLLGNGINARIGINNLDVNCIAKRFENNVLDYSPIIESLFKVKLEGFLTYIENQTSNKGIESLAEILYKYIKSNVVDSWSDNDEYRIQDVITCICLTSIFYTNDGKIKDLYNKAKVPLMNDYDFIFTLNYFEFWDKNNKCIHLHGKIDFSKLYDKPNVILVSKKEMNLKEYANSVEKIKKKKNVIEIDTDDIILAPNCISKNNLFRVSGFVASNKLTVADDLYLYEKKRLYIELDQIDELDIFGMSPYGDEFIIEKINSKNKVQVYIYNLQSNKEKKTWEEKLTCKYELLDSRKI